MKAKIIRILLLTTVSFCFFLSMIMLYSFYRDHYPVAAPGECLEYVSDNVVSTIHIISNDNFKGQSIVLVDIEMDNYNSEGVSFTEDEEPELIGPMPMTYEELRELKMEKVDCE